MRCSQGDLEACKRINLEKWKQAASVDINKISSTAQKTFQKETLEKKQIALDKINKLIEEESLSAKRKGREELKIRRETDRLREEIKWSRGMTDE